MCGPPLLSLAGVPLRLKQDRLVQTRFDGSKKSFHMGLAPVSISGGRRQTMADTTNRGFLILADISGYTAFVTKTELEHGPPIITALLEAVIERIAPPLDVLQIEGDAVFALGVDGTVVPPVTLLDVLRSGFAGFHARQVELAADDSCDCGACAGVAKLKLKIIGHHGAYLEQTIGGRTQAVGSDVILAHRLLKNGVSRDDHYALLTRPALDSMGVDPTGAGISARIERYEHFGDIPCFVMGGLTPESPCAEAVGTHDARVGLA
jgi:hypothetical protein